MIFLIYKGKKLTKDQLRLENGRLFDATVKAVMEGRRDDAQGFRTDRREVRRLLAA